MHTMITIGKENRIAGSLGTPQKPKLNIIFIIKFINFK